ncbi:hypothetical protein V8F33_005048 [Rhypophila sp. PSN 637]
MDAPRRWATFVTGVDKDVWSPEPDSKHDLVCVDDTGPWITQYLVLLYHDILGRHVHRSDPEGVPHLRNSVSYDNSSISRMAKVFTTVAGALFPVVSIVILYAIDDTKKRLGVLAVVTVLFSLCMSLGTRAGVAEVFGASAAFAAVLVVFIGTSDSSASGTGAVSMNSTTSRGIPDVYYPRYSYFWTRRSSCMALTSTAGILVTRRIYRTAMTV